MRLPAFLNVFVILVAILLSGTLPGTKPIRSLRRLADAGRRRARAGQPLRRRHLRQDRLAARSDRLEDRPASGRRQESESGAGAAADHRPLDLHRHAAGPARANGAARSTTPTMGRPTRPTSPCRATLRLRSRAAWACSAAARPGRDLRPRRPPHLARGRSARSRQNIADVSRTQLSAPLRLTHSRLWRHRRNARDRCAKAPA